jgi:hypothetical protein
VQPGTTGVSDSPILRERLADHDQDLPIETLLRRPAEVLPSTRSLTLSMPDQR